MLGTTLAFNLGLIVLILPGILLLFLHLTPNDTFKCPNTVTLGHISHGTWLSVAIATGLSMILVAATSFLVFLYFIQFYVVNAKSKYTYRVTRDIFEIEE